MNMKDNKDNVTQIDIVAINDETDLLYQKSEKYENHIYVLNKINIAVQLLSVISVIICPITKIDFCIIGFQILWGLMYFISVIILGKKSDKFFKDFLQKSLKKLANKKS